MAQQLESEEITVGILLRASLVERREILRSMGLRFGQIMSLNQALEHRKQGAAAEGGGAAEEAAAAAAAAAEEEEEEEDEEEGEEEEEEDSEGEGETESEAEAGDTPAAAAVLPQAGSGVGGGERGAATYGPKLQAAAVLLRGAEVHTLKGLHVYLNNVLLHPGKLGFRTIQLANPIFHARVWAAPGGAAMLRAAGAAPPCRRPCFA